jgi:hypothetical protein
MVEEERPAPSQTPPAAPLASVIEDVVHALWRSLRQELRRTLLGVVAGLMGIILLLVAGLGFAVAGVMRLGDALGRLCGQWFGNQALGDVVVGLVLLAVPLVGIVILRLRTW